MRQVTEGNAYTGPVADVWGGTAPYQVTVQWGDGTNTQTAMATSGELSPGHTYADEGTYQVSIQVTDAAGSAMTASLAVSTADAPLAISATARQSAENQAWSGRLATFSDGNPLSTAAEFTASVDWGDGTTGAGTLEAGCYCVDGTHTYAEGGSYTVRVTVSDDGGSSASTTAAFTVADAPLSSAGYQVITLHLPSDTTYTGPVATFSDADTTDGPGAYTTSIAWGDGAVTSGTLAGGNGQYTVSGSHTYVLAGSYVITVSVADTGGSTTQAQTVLVVE